VDLRYRILRPPVRAEPIRARLEIRLEDRFQHRLQAGLDHAIRDSRDTELAELPAFLRYQHLPHFDRPELTRLQRIPDLPQEFRCPNPGLDSGHRGSINTGGPCPGVAGNALPRMHQKRRAIDEVEQVTEPAGRILSRPAVQLGLHLPYCEIRRIWMRPSHGARIPRRIFGHYSSSLTDTLPSFPMRRAFPGSEYYDGSAPPAPFGWRRAYPPAPARTAGSTWNSTRAVPTFTAARSTGEVPGFTPAASPRLRRRPSPWSRWPRRVKPCQKFPTPERERVRTANQPLSTGFELATSQEA